MLSTIHNEEMVQGRRNAAQQKPKCISGYKYMGGVDRTYRLLQPYEIARKSLKWYRKLEIHLLQLAMLNVSCFSRQMGVQSAFWNFSVMSFLSLYLVRTIVPIMIFQDGKMFSDLQKGSLLGKFHQQKAQKRCKVCYKKNIRKETRYYCPSCPSTPGLCYYPCFRIYHTTFVYQANTWKNYITLIRAVEILV